MRKVPVKDILENSHSLINESVLYTASTLEGCYFVVKLDDRLKERGMTQSELASITGLRVGTISTFISGKELGLNKIHIFSIMAILRITDINDIIEIRFPDEMYDEFQEDTKHWIEDKKAPAKVETIHRKNVNRKFE